jgi:hypothetical protein
MSAARLVLLLGAVLLGAAAQAARPQELRGRLLDEGGNPLSGQNVFLLPGDFKVMEEAKRITDEALATEKTDAKGRFSFERLEKGGGRRRGKGLPPGEYLVAAVQEEKSAPTGLRVAAQPAVVGKKKTAEVEVRFLPVAPSPAEKPPEAGSPDGQPQAKAAEGPVLEGTVMDGSGKPLEGIRIAVSQASAGLQSAQTDKEGRFSLPGLLAGAAELRISGIPGSLALQVQEKLELPPKGTVRMELRISQSPKG